MLGAAINLLGCSIAKQQEIRFKKKCLKSTIRCATSIPFKKTAWIYMQIPQCKWLWLISGERVLFDRYVLKSNINQHCVHMCGCIVRRALTAYKPSAFQNSADSIQTPSALQMPVKTLRGLCKCWRKSFGLPARHICVHPSSLNNNIHG